MNVHAVRTKQQAQFLCRYLVRRLWPLATDVVMHAIYFTDPES